MVFCVREIEALRLLGWCQYIRPAQLLRVVSETELSNLLAMKLIKYHSKSEALILTAEGRRLLAGTIWLPDTPRTDHADAIVRRLRLASLLLTAYQSGINVYATQPDELVEGNALFLTSAGRGRGRNPWGSTRTAALLHVGDLLCAAHYVCPDIGCLCPIDELSAFQNNTAKLPGTRSFLFCGESYSDMLTELDKPMAEDESKLMTYGAAARWFQQPVYLLACNDTGVTQLQIMAQPDYRQRLTRLALKGHYSPPPPDRPCWDALFQGQPFVLAADMELRRVDTAYTLAREQGYSQLVLAALPQQVAEVWGPRYQDTRKARVFTLTEDAITQLLGKTPKPYRPLDTPYVTEKGEMIHAPLIKAAGKAGGYR